MSKSRSTKEQSTYYATLLQKGHSTGNTGSGRAIYERRQSDLPSGSNQRRGSSSGLISIKQQPSEGFLFFQDREEVYPTKKKKKKQEKSASAPYRGQRSKSVSDQQPTANGATFDSTPFEEVDEEEALKGKGLLSRLYTRYVPYKVRRFISAISPFHFNADRQERAYERTRDARRPRREARALAEKMKYSRLQCFRNWLAKLFGKPEWQEDPADASRHYYPEKVERVFAEKSR